MINVEINLKLIRPFALIAIILWLIPDTSSAQISCLEKLTGKIVVWNQEWQKDHQDHNQLYRVTSLKIYKPDYEPLTASLVLESVNKADISNRSVKISRDSVANVFCRAAAEETVSKVRSLGTSQMDRAFAESQRRDFVRANKGRADRVFSLGAKQALSSHNININSKAVDYQVSVGQYNFGKASAILAELEAVLDSLSLHASNVKTRRLAAGYMSR